MRKAISYRNNIPFFCEKSETEFKKDKYEKYDPSVIRQAILHLADDLWGTYPFQPILDFINDQLPKHNNLNILELGSGVGRMIADISKVHASNTCWGIDYSYQLVKKAKETWIDGKDMDINFMRYGFDLEHKIHSHKLENLHFGLGKAEQLPFADQSQDFVFSSFLLDRLSNPISGLKEMKRVLKPEGKIVIVSPLNFEHPSHWEKFYPPTKLYKILPELHFTILDWKEDMIVEEPLDKRRNCVKWNCVRMVIQ